MSAPSPPRQPPPDCPLCPRLARFRAENRTAFPDFHNAPVESFGPLTARLLVVGLAPGLRGANRTGRPFTGDFAGDLLYRTLVDFGFATGTYERRADDDLRLLDCRVTNAVRCVPPENKPLPAETRTCRSFLAEELAGLTQLRVIVALGRIAHESIVNAAGGRPSQFRFAHGAAHQLPSGRRLLDSYHCSRYNTQTGVLTEDMFREIFAEVTALLE
jgi:uracil-DNA glycosylase family 4